MREGTRDYLELAKLNWAEGGEKDSDALWPIAAALISIAESHKRVADALEKQQEILNKKLDSIGFAIDESGARR